MNELGQLWHETARAALALVASGTVAERWDEASCLPGMTIGEVSGHLLHSGILLVDEALNATAAPDGRPVSAATLFSWVPLDQTNSVHDDVRSVAEDQAVEGHDDVVRRATEALHRAELELESASSDRVVGFWDGAYAMRLDELLRARILELIVHSDDLAVSVGMDAPPVPDDAVALTCRLGVDIAITRHGRVNVLRALFRNDRATQDSLRTF